MENNNIKVYIKVREDNAVIDINSDVFITDFTDWIFFDEGEGDKFALAQNNYLELPLVDEYGIYNYEFIDGEVRLRSKEKEIEIIEKRARIVELKRFLSETDYKAIKYAEGEITEEEYAPFKAQRRAWRAEINYIEEEINNG